MENNKIDEKYHDLGNEPKRYFYEGQEEWESLPFSERTYENPDYLIMVDGKQVNIYEVNTPETKAARLEWILKRPSPEPTDWTVIEASLKRFAKTCDFDMDGHHHQFYFENGIKKYFDGWDGSTIDTHFMKTGVRTYDITERGGNV